VNKGDFLKVWGYLDVLERDYEQRARAAADNKELDEERRRRLVTDYTMRSVDIHQLKEQIQAEADRITE